MEKLNKISDEELNQKYTDWIGFFDYAEREPMSRDVSEIFLKLSIMEESFMMEKESNNFSIALAKKRANFIKLDITDAAVLFIVMLVNGIPGNIVMYLYYLKFYQLTHDNIPITITVIANIFPLGFPTEKSLNTLWDLQKINGFNMLDIIEHDFETHQIYNGKQDLD